MNRLIEWCIRSKVVLLIFPTYPDLFRWLQTYRYEIMESGATIKLTIHKITFLNGSVLYLGHANKEEEFEKFLSLEYDIVIGGNEELRRRALMNKL